MNFFNSIFSDDPEPSISPKSPPNNPADSELDNPNPETESGTTIDESSSNDEDPDALWSFGSLIKTITTRSESVIGNYRRDFEEFGSGLLKETALIRDVASRAVQELPDSIDSGAAVAQESLETVGQAIDNLGSSVWEGTSQILARGKELNLFNDDDDVLDDDGTRDDNLGGQLSERSLNVKKYSWFDTRMREIQGDSRTYTEDPDDSEDYKKWKSGFLLDENGEEIGKLMEEERILERIYLELVPVTVDKENFWSRYLYKIDKLKQAEESRARIVKRAISGNDDDEELTWDVDDDDDDDEIHDVPPKIAVAEVSTADVSPESQRVENIPLAQEVECKNAVETVDVGQTSDPSEAIVDTKESKSSENKVSGEKNESYDSSKDSDISIISTQPSLLAGEEELGWDEIEDLGSDDDGKKITASSSSKVSDLHKRLNSADEEEDLSWDIEDDDDEAMKS